MSRDRPAARLIKCAGDLFKPSRIRKPIALADILAEQIAQFRALFDRKLWWATRRLAQPGEFAGLASGEQVPPDFGPIGLGIGQIGDVLFKQRLEVRGVRQIIRRPAAAYTRAGSRCGAGDGAGG